MKKSFSILCFCATLLLSACGKPEISENRNVSACGVNDPLQNLTWLNAYCQTIPKQKDLSSIYIHLYRTIGKDEFFFESAIRKKSEKKHHFTEYRNCDGEVVHEKIIPISTSDGPNYVPPMPDPWLDDKELVDRLFSYVK